MLAELRVVVDEPLHPSLEAVELLHDLRLERLDREERDEPHHRAHLERTIVTVGVEHVVVEAVALVPEVDAFAAEVVHCVGDVDEVFEELRRHVLVRRVLLRQLERDRQHAQTVHPHPRRPVRLLDVPPRRERCRPVEHADVVQAEKAPLEDVLPLGVLPVHPPREVQEQLVEHPLQKRPVPPAPEPPLDPVHPERRLRGRGDRAFLERVFHKLLLNFTWWVNREDAEGKNVFQGGFLGLDNIGVFDRSAPLPTGGHIEQSDGTSWMGMYCLNMLAIALELAKQDPAYEDVASKFFEHFVYIAHAMHDLGGAGNNLWDEEDGFYYDVLHANGDQRRLKVRSMVGLVPLFAVETLEPEIVEKLHGFKRRMQWFIDNHPEFREHVETATKPGVGPRRLLVIVP